MFCPECGCRNDDNSKFCVSCGTPLAMFFQPQTPAYTPNEQPMYAPAAQPETPTYNPAPMRYTPEAPAYNPAPEVYSPNPAAKPKKSGNGIAAAISSIMTFFMFFLPWLSIWAWSLSYIDMMDVSGDLGWILDEAETISAVLIICMIAFSVLAIITIVKGFKGRTSGCGIAAGIIGIIMVLALAIAIEFELEYMGVGAYLFLASSIVLIILSSKK